MSRDLLIGTLVDSAPVTPARVLAPRLNRHTFWCGESCSGETYALGVLLEQVLLHTRLPLVVLDPNSDFSRLGEVRHEAPAREAAELAARDVRVFRPGDPARPLHARFLRMPLRSRVALLQIGSKAWR
ncbi:helicase HerA domain-containing protein [Microbacterium kunmingense]|uniref:helicase HerA domain-containing protein n=1 Tax=Microbacterium kunmingense TaxID=2915939 RepID=UPI003D75493D